MGGLLGVAIDQIHVPIFLFLMSQVCCTASKRIRGQKDPLYAETGVILVLLPTD